MDGDISAAVDYLEQRTEGQAKLPSAEAARILAEAIKPRDGGSERVKRLRRIVFRWVWEGGRNV